MRKLHIFSSSWDVEELSFFANLGIVVPKDGWGRVEVPDGDQYERVCDFFAEIGRPLNDFVFFEYTKEELLAAPYCVIELFIQVVILSRKAPIYPRPMTFMICVRLAK